MAKFYEITTKEGDMLDDICKDEYKDELPYNITATVYALNQDLALYGEVFPKGVRIKLPLIVKDEAVQQMVNVWD